jgi:glycosyltransferase involved in cell wall biosynthesis
MKLAYATTFDAQDVGNWSGTPHYMSKSFAEQGAEVDYIGSLKRRLPAGFKLTQFWKSIACGQRESPRFNVVAAKHYSEQVARHVSQLDVQAVIAPQINPVAYLECKQPTVIWTDALYGSLLGFYPGFSNHSATSIAQGNKITAECLERSKLVIFSSDWAARSALELYGARKEKIKVVPFGANIDCSHTLADIQAMLTERSRTTIKFLFMGKHWGRKGGDIVFRVVKALHAQGQSVELNFVGCQPPEGEVIPDYIKCHGFISKRKPEGMAKITQLLRESHFLFVPSRAEACAIVLAEANAFGLPALTSYVGGISTVVKDNINGMTFALDADTSTFCNYIVNLMQNYSRYEELALSAFNEYQTRLNWKVATNTVKQLIQENL